MVRKEEYSSGKSPPIAQDQNMAKDAIIVAQDQVHSSEYPTIQTTSKDNQTTLSPTSDLDHSGVEEWGDEDSGRD